MRLKSLQIKGFKSFANDTILHFNENVIGVVGPNGSGKSNIVDAIRWVLGEQKSKELRLEAMSDIIFNGTKTKKQSATATVALTFENDKGLLPTEYQFVTISRTLYRSGESEYKLNNVVCRLKDINSLFLDTGIGSNSYAIIALGMVDDILDDKENARRKMFEQAAGVSKYKLRKKETLSKLKSTTEDLNRIEDLLFEIEGNLKTLEKQAKRTQKYLEIKEEYKNLSIKYSVFSIQSLKERYKKVAELLREQQDQYRENDTLYLKKQALVEKEKKQNLDKEILLSERQKSLGDLVYQIRTKENEKGLLNQKKGFKNQNKESLTKSIKETEVEVEKLNIDVIQLNDRLKSEIETENTLKANFEKSKGDHEALKNSYLQIKSVFDENQKAIFELDKRKYEIEKNIAILNNNEENLVLEINRNKEVLKSKEKEESENKREYDQLSQEINKKTNELRSLENNEEHRLQKIQELESNKEVAREAFTKHNRTLDSRQNEYDLLKSMIENFEGFPESIKFLNENWKKNPIILSDILDVQEEYKAIIEGYLEQFLNYFVVDEVAEALKAINLLAKAQKGKANFFLNYKFNQLNPNWLSIPNATPAVNFVKVESKYQPLLNFLLQNCYIYEGSPDDLTYFENYENSIFLSINGQYSKSKFVISGGSIGLFEGKKIGRKQNLEKLSATIIKMTEQKLEKEKELQSLESENQLLKKSDLPANISQFKKELNSLEQALIKVQIQFETYKKTKVEWAEKEHLAKEKIKSLKLNIEQLTDELHKIEINKENLIQSFGKDETDVSALNEQLTKASEKHNQDNVFLIRHQNLIQNLEKEVEYKNIRLSESIKKLDNDRIKLLGEEKEKIDIEDQLNSLEKSLLALYNEKKTYQSTLTEAEQDYFKAKNAILSLEDELRNLTRIQNQIQQSVQNLKDEFTELKFKINAVGDRLRIEFDIPINNLINLEADPSLNYEEVKEEVEKLKYKISNFGEINPLALEAYNEMKLRFESIQVQRKDILDAKDSLMSTIKEIETTATAQFFTAFNKIRDNFIEVFRSLFTEDDTCDLILLDKDNPLESDIEIIAKPKGKKPKSLSQLSGGEKTLTATALLFALYLLKPAPFCIFDEVDAPLDDANIQKFNKIIKKFSSDSQFIIVTHNKATMVEVDVLYGVYMQELGVSAVSPVDFRGLKYQTTAFIN